ncbi:hypothetical protein IKZ77_01630 [Candidatus Saccharibacteria bacterium]|nr:hypothetical protein [Candidatus Saccharibacteria bacterium]
MEGQEYLNQISASNRPEKKSMNRFFSSKFFIFAAISAVILIAIMILGAIINGSKGDEKELNYKLKLHIDNTAKVIQNYQPLVKSSVLRSSSASLSSILSNTSRELNDYLVEKYNFKDKDVDKKIVEAATAKKDELETELFEAKINGILDRIYAHKMTYEISSIMGEEAKLINSSKNAGLKDLLTTSYQSLDNLYKNFSEFSETK